MSLETTLDAVSAAILVMCKDSDATNGTMAQRNLGNDYTTEATGGSCYAQIVPTILRKSYVESNTVRDVLHIKLTAFHIGDSASGSDWQDLSGWISYNMQRFCDPDNWTVISGVHSIINPPEVDTGSLVREDEDLLIFIGNVTLALT